MIEKYTLEMLNQDGVTIRKENMQEVNGHFVVIGQPWFRAYENSVLGRQQIQEEISEPYKSVIMLMWGDNPTVI